MSKVTDLLAVALAYGIVYALHRHILHNVSQHPNRIWIVLLIILPVAHVTYRLNGLYAENTFLRLRPFVMWRIVLLNLIMLGTTTLVLYYCRNTWFPRRFFILVYLCNILLTIALRKGIRAIAIVLVRRWKVWQRPTILIGATPEAEQIAAVIEAKHPFGLTIAETLPAHDGAIDMTLLEERILRHRARMVIVADTALPLGPIMEIIALADRHRCAAKVLSITLAVLFFRAGESFDLFRGVPLVHFAPSSFSRKHLWHRRIASQCLAAIALIALSPVFALIALGIKLSDGGKVFFSQTRYGEKCAPFSLYKFRTMCADAESMLPELENRNEANGALFKIKDDPRVTPLGRFLRRFSLDELPQIYNVLKGDMRIIGPRPLPRRDLDHYSQKWHYYRNDGKPGLSCLWQVSGRSDIAFDDMCILDIYYLHNQRWEMDAHIVFRTLWVMLVGRGAY